MAVFDKVKGLFGRNKQQPAEDLGLMPGIGPGWELEQEMQGKPKGKYAGEWNSQGYAGEGRPQIQASFNPAMVGESPVRSEPEEEAYRMGQRMGVESILDKNGIALTEEQKMSTRKMSPERIHNAAILLLKYRSGKTSVDNRIIRAQEWWKMRNWEMIQEQKGRVGSIAQKSATGWLWNSIVGKHADAIDSYPEPLILPRMQDDKDEAKVLSQIVPVVMEMNGFEETYNDCAWQKMQEGTGAYGVFWDPGKLNGLGDVSIQKINMLNLFWEPGITDIQKSRNLFYVTETDNAELEEAYPELEGKLRSNRLLTLNYRTDDTVERQDKSAVVDWYYFTRNNGRKVLQYCKFVDEYVLYSSEEDPEMAEKGWYTDGMYPFVLDPLFPVEGSPAGYGYIDIGKDAQTDIDTLNQAMVLNAEANATPRYFSRKDGGINEKEFMDWRRPIVHTNGNLGQDSIMPIQSAVMSSEAFSMLNQKIDELKYITGNTDVENGGVPSGVTAASAIAALKEDSGRSSKDSTKAAYRAYRQIVTMVIERIRQFYDLPRQFRIIGENGEEEFRYFNNEAIKPQRVAGGVGLEEGMRLPVFDIEVRAQRENAYTRMSQNELALDLMSRGFFSPQNADIALMALDMMDFKGKDQLVTKIKQNGTMLDALQKVGQMAMIMANQYRPDIMPQIAQVLQGILMDAGGGMPIMQGGGDAMQSMNTADAAEKPTDPNENKIVSRAKERAANASRPD